MNVIYEKKILVTCVIFSSILFFFTLELNVAMHSVECNNNNNSSRSILRLDKYIFRSCNLLLPLHPERFPLRLKAFGVLSETAGRLSEIVLALGVLLKSLCQFQVRPYERRNSCLREFEKDFDLRWISLTLNLNPSFSHRSCKTLLSFPIYPSLTYNRTGMLRSKELTPLSSFCTLIFPYLRTASGIPWLYFAYLSNSLR